VTNYTGPLYETFGTPGWERYSQQVDPKTEVDLPENEIHYGIVSVEIKLYGDGPNVPLVRVTATTQKRADAVYDQVLRSLTKDLIEVWVRE
jgi:hypothetical protein